MSHACLAFLALAATALAQKRDPFAEGVRTTEPLPPTEQRAKFKLPPGFEIQLVAAEPELRKPMNMAFDAAGRLWVSESREYPFPAKKGAELRDSIRIFSDFGPDGRARKMEIFADGLNIPIGLYPFRTGKNWKCIAWSIPNIWLFEDTDGDGKADKREVLFGPLGWERDTHGNQASFRRGDDGWIYATHGFNNQSTFKAKDGSTISLTSGNTYRFRTDGSRIEQWTFGQVNPFGLCWDDRGNLFSADCHSSPLYQLLRGGEYQGFGRPHTGLGFAPITVQHSHNSTAICAPIMVRDTSWPAGLQGHMFVGNVMTSRLNHDAIEWRGSSSKGKELPDFLTCDDPWFRPVDLQWGPDGALYIADFYNRIIGHYEVPLTHPGRDRERGRIWRVVYRGEKGDGKLLNPALHADLDGLVKELASTNPTRRTLALNEICDRFEEEALPQLEAAANRPVNSLQKSAALHGITRLSPYVRYSENRTVISAFTDNDPMVRTHAIQAAADKADWWEPLDLVIGAKQPPPERKVVLAVIRALNDTDAVVCRAAVEALAAHPAPDNVKPLLALLSRTEKTDDHLIYATRVALRDHLRDADTVKWIKLDGLSKDDLQAVLGILPAVPGEHAALLRLDLFEKLDVAPNELAKQLPSIIKNAPATRLDAVAALARKKLPADATAFASILDALDARGVQPGESLREWAVVLVPQFLSTKAAGGWTHTGAGKNPWAMQERKCADGESAQVMSSIVGGETLTGVLRSAPFAAPEKLRFFLCGQDGMPGKPAGKKNFVRLVDADGKTLREAVPPRNDVAQRIEWDLADAKGRSVRFEATDGADGAAYAWLAFGRFKPEMPELAFGGSAKPPRALAATLVARFKMTEHAKALGDLFADRKADVPSRAEAARALVALRNVTQPVPAVPASGTGGTPVSLSALAAALSSADEPDALREQVAIALGSVTSPGICQLVADAMPTAPARLQQSFAGALSANRCGTVVLITAIENGKASPVVLRDKATVDRLRAAAKGGELTRLDALLAKLPPANIEADKRIVARRAAFDPAKADAAKGAAIFKTQCAVCHQIGKVGALVGPQLDGIGARGLDRILEDMLDPNRNVDRAFRLSVVTLKDGGIASGLFRREEGAQLILADFTGKEVAVPLANVAKREESDTSLMPAAFGEAIPEKDFADLLAFLLSQKATK